VTIAGISLDAYGTLIYAPRIAGIYVEVLVRHGITTNVVDMQRVIPAVWAELSCRRRHGEDRFASHPGGSRGFWRDIAGRICAHLGTDPPSRFATAELYDRFAHPDAWQVYDDVPLLLETLGRSGLKLAVLSNFDERLTGLLEALGLAAAFDAIIVSSEVGVEKPHPAIFEALLGRLELAPDEVVHIGDTRGDDVEGAFGAGLHGIWLQRDGGGDITSLAELPARLARNENN